jgi:predicted nucleotidyltransferase
MVVVCMNKRPHDDVSMFVGYVMHVAADALWSLRCSGGGRACPCQIEREMEALEEDTRVVSAWLSGSFAADTADDWSDVDLYTVVRDEDYALFVEQRGALHDRLGEVVGTQAIDSERTFENPGSQFDLLIYRGGLEVDWTIMPLQLAHRPGWARLLLDRMDIPVDSIAPESEEETRIRLQGQLDFFWAMVAVGQKEVGRSYTTGAAASVERLTDAFDILWRRVHRPNEPRPELRAWRHRTEITELTAMTPRLGKDIGPNSVLDVIRQLCAAVERMHPNLREKKVSIPEEMAREMAAPDELALAAALVT